MQFAKVLLYFVATIGLVAASPLRSRDDCQCAVCDAGPGDCQGADLDAFNQCAQAVKDQCGRSCFSLGAGSGAQDGCLAAEISIMKPCENKCVQARLKATAPPSRLVR